MKAQSHYALLLRYVSLDTFSTVNWFSIPCYLARNRLAGLKLGFQKSLPVLAKSGYIFKPVLSFQKNVSSFRFADPQRGAEYLVKCIVRSELPAPLILQFEQRGHLFQIRELTEVLRKSRNVHPLGL